MRRRFTLIAFALLLTTSPAFATAVRDYSMLTPDGSVGTIHGADTDALTDPHNWYISSIDLNFSMISDEVRGILSRGVVGVNTGGVPSEGGFSVEDAFTVGPDDTLDGFFKRVTDCELNCAILRLNAFGYEGSLSLFAAHNNPTTGFFESATWGTRVLLVPLDASGEVVPEPSTIALCLTGSFLLRRRLRGTAGVAPF